MIASVYRTSMTSGISDIYYACFVPLKVSRYLDASAKFPLAGHTNSESIERGFTLDFIPFPLVRLRNSYYEAYSPFELQPVPYR